MKKYNLLLLLALVVLPIGATQPTKAFDVIQQTVHIIEKNNIQTNFKMVITDKMDETLQVMSGQFKMSGNKFALKMDEMEVYYDGKTQWAYVPTNGEVSITEPTPTELAQTNPLSILSQYVRNSKVSFDKKQHNTNYHSVLLLPTKKQMEYEKIIVKVNKKNKQPLSIQLIDKNGINTTLSFAGFQQISKIKKTDFIFDTKAYKDIEINDLR